VSGLVDAAPSRLAGIARASRTRGASPGGDAVARCELCAAPIDADHPHLLEVMSRQVRCACRACGVLFDRHEAALGRLRRIPDRRWRLPLGDGGVLAWAAFGVPVDLAFFVLHQDARVAAYYPGPAGITRADVDAAAWSAMVAANPPLAALEDEVEALLVRHTADGGQQWLVPVDDCFRLVGVLREAWQGFTGGTAVWRRLDEFFDGLERRAKPPPRRDREESTDGRQDQGGPGQGGPGHAVAHGRGQAGQPQGQLRAADRPPSGRPFHGDALDGDQPEGARPGAAHDAEPVAAVMPATTRRSR
jgi:hypothetical protein